MADPRSERRTQDRVVALFSSRSNARSADRHSPDLRIALLALNRTRTLMTFPSYTAHFQPFSGIH